MGVQPLLSAVATLASSCLASQDPRVQVALTLDTPCNGVSTTGDGRLVYTPHGQCDAAGALIVLDLDSSRAVRLLEGDLSVGAFTPTSGEGTFRRSSSGEPWYIYADQLEVSPDGKWFYYQPASGGRGGRMSRIETKFLDEAFYNSSMASLGVLSACVEPYALTPSAGGTAIDSQGNIHVSDTDHQAIEKNYPNGTRTTIVQGDRLLWVDAMWVDNQNRLWLPAAQLNRRAPFQPDGQSQIVKTVYVYKIDL